VKLSTRFAVDLDKAEKAEPLKPKAPIRETTISGTLADKRTLSNASSTGSNATTLVGKELEPEELSPTQSQVFYDNSMDRREFWPKIFSTDSTWQILRQNKRFSD